jgi:hypothetical protein
MRIKLKLSNHTVVNDVVLHLAVIYCKIRIISGM